MPPEQCPECGRFLKNALVVGLADGPAPCPRCGSELTADMFATTTGPVDADAIAAGDAAADADEAADAAADADAAVAADAAAAVDADAGEDDIEVVDQLDQRDVSVRPPDLTPEQVQAQPPDVLAGWDIGADAAEIAGWRADERPFPTDTVVVAGAGVLGAVVGLTLTAEHRARGAVSGGVAGVLVAAIIRRIWRLEP